MGRNWKANMTRKSRTKNELSRERIQSFCFTAPAARSVQLVGDFTNWQQKPISLQRSGAGVWRTAVALTPGTHQYRFLVDGEWRDDPACQLHVANPFGTQDAVRQVA
jgi:1,4-alpha-glucan branching enzyme